MRLAVAMAMAMSRASCTQYWASVSMSGFKTPETAGVGARGKSLRRRRKEQNPTRANLRSWPVSLRCRPVCGQRDHCGAVVSGCGVRVSVNRIGVGRPSFTSRSWCCLRTVVWRLPCCAVLREETSQKAKKVASRFPGASLQPSSQKLRSPLSAPVAWDWFGWRPQLRPRTS